VDVELDTAPTVDVSDMWERDNLCRGATQVPRLWREAGRVGGNDGDDEEEAQDTAAAPGVAPVAGRRDGDEGGHAMTADQRKTTSAPVMRASSWDGRFRFVLSTGDVDRLNDRINPHGWRLESYRRNPVVLLNHDATALPVARTAAIGVEGNALVATAEFPPRGVYPVADQVRDLIEAGFLSAASVGFRPIRCEPNRERGGIDFLEQELLEWSVVGVPANAAAMLEGRSAEAVRKWLASGAGCVVETTSDDPTGTGMNRWPDDGVWDVLLPDGRVERLRVDEFKAAVRDGVVAGLQERQAARRQLVGPIMIAGPNVPLRRACR
jgi:HK97 family phage prohead protease